MLPPRRSQIYMCVWREREREMEGDREREREGERNRARKGLPGESTR